MTTKINPALAHAYKRKGRPLSRLLITMEITTWATRRASGEEFPGESCIFFSVDGGKSWAELYLLDMTGDRCAKFSARTLNPTHAMPCVVDGAGGNVEYMNHPYELITDESVDFTNVAHLTDADRARIRQMHY